MDQLGDQEQEAYQQWQKLDAQLTKDKATLTNLKNHLDELKGGSQQQPSETYTVTVNYVDQNGQQIQSQVLTGKAGQAFSADDLQLPAGYQLVNPATEIIISSQNRAVTVAVMDKQVRETITYVDDNGQTVGSQVLTGKPGQQFIAGNLEVPAGYELAQNDHQGYICITLGDTDGQYTVYVTAQPTKKTGFQHEDGGVVYYDQNGERVMGEQVIDGYTYYFEPKANGLMATGPIAEQMGDPYYLFNEQGQKQGAGEHQYNGKWYYCDPQM